MPSRASLAARHFVASLSRSQSSGNIVETPHDPIHSHAFSYSITGQRCILHPHLCAHAGKPNLALADKSRPSVLSLCVRLSTPSGLLS
jgi:hypothetical protein